ncbi:acyl-CoA synthetase [Acuticoccus sediminis]|uniref:3-methylmercaptopropionyl-CoA ligase n=1 Tax=Acuticoccus sediminis TaxID=2184697 RepID=A0A8B2NKF2_9HYPH|nr:AMP-binding protein [Acuticoccus sediminis]RAH98364.1 acyl-CoA synthetase [Acuticoccus sediminis]
MRNLSTQLDFHARVRPDAEALVYAGQRITWRGLQERVRQTAAGLAAAGVGADTIVALMMKNSAATIELLYAISHLGAVSLPLNFRLSTDEVRYIVGHAGAALIVADDAYRDTLADMPVPVHHLDEAAQRDSRAAFGGHGERPAATRRDSGDLFRLMYTSGTTDRPKGVTHTYESFEAKNVDLAIALGLSASDRLLVVGPLYHVGGCDLPGLAVHMMGGTMVLQRDYDAAAVLSAIAAEAITGVWLAPVMMAGLLELDRSAVGDVSSLRWCIAGGERTPATRIRAFAEAFPSARYVDAYGMTETVSGDTLMEAGYELDKIGSVGRPVRQVEVEIRDAEGLSLPPGEIGEVCMRGPKVTTGYWKDPERTDAAFFADGFLRSGDIGYLDADGFLFLTDRMKDMIISGGENIASSEVERVLFEMPQVLDAAVVAMPDARWGEIPFAVVVPRPGQEVTIDAIANHCEGRLARFKVPRKLLLVDALPRNPSGKVLKRVLREMALDTG